jgi:tetratricopeptide (TPR) repeat protein
MENLSTRGLVDLGHSFLVRGQQSEAEKYLEQALAAAERSKARRNEARARVAMASLRQQQNRPDEAVRFLEPALAFYQQGGYPSESFSCLALLARVNLQKGEYAAADKSQEELLRLAQVSNDQSLVALAHAERGSALTREQRFPEALDHLNQAYAIYSSQGIQRSMGYNLQSRGEVFGYLGRVDEAKAALEQAIAIAEKPGGELRRLSIESQLMLAELALMQGQFPDAKARAEKVLTAAGKEFKNVVTGAKIVLGLSQSYTGAKAAGKQTMVEAVQLAGELNDPSELAHAQMALATSMLLAGDSGAALSSALQAQQVCERLGQPASEWQALLLAAQANQNTGDKTKAREYAMRAKDTLSRLEQRWGSENYNSYLSRPDVQRLKKQLEQLAATV